ncbi:MAG: carbon-nitrogen hydrolase family protein [Acidobacteriales bacterium]|nr:carbon-nitrogen hydrolase family protein [Terriglobales bacterium]
MMRWTVLLAVAGILAAAPGALYKQSGFEADANGMAPGWRVWSPRAGTAPRAYVDASRGRERPGSLVLSGSSNLAVCGGWEREVQGVAPREWYRLTAHYRVEGPVYERSQVVARLDWRNAKGERVGQPDYAPGIERVGDWKRVTLDAPAPEGATNARVQLLLLYAPQATVWWDGIAVERIAAPAPRRVTIAAVNFRPASGGTPESNVSGFIDAIGKSVSAGTDVILLSEIITSTATGRPYEAAGEPVPGPTTARLGEVARARKAYIVAGLVEREGAAVYNASVLIDRAGRLVGKYRKVYLPREEMEGGLTPGGDYPVFRTDFGTVGMMICWDLQFADPARALALAGAEVILMPIAGGSTVLDKARAIENRVFVASAGYSFPTRIVDPDGEIIAEAKERGTAAVATIDLARRYTNPWLGNMHDRFRKEVRLDISTEPR